MQNNKWIREIAETYRNMLSERLLNEYGPNHPKMRELRNKPQRGGPHGLDLHQAQRRLAVSQVLKKAVTVPMVRDKAWWQREAEEAVLGQAKPTGRSREEIQKELLKQKMKDQPPMIPPDAFWRVGRSPSSTFPAAGGQPRRGLDPRRIIAETYRNMLWEQVKDRPDYPVRELRAMRMSMEPMSPAPLPSKQELDDASDDGIVDLGLQPTDYNIAVNLARPAGTGRQRAVPQPDKSEQSFAEYMDAERKKGREEYEMMKLVDTQVRRTLRRRGF